MAKRTILIMVLLSTVKITGILRAQNVPTEGSTSQNSIQNNPRPDNQSAAIDDRQLHVEQSQNVPENYDPNQAMTEVVDFLHNRQNLSQPEPITAPRNFWQINYHSPPFFSNSEFQLWRFAVAGGLRIQLSQTAESGCRNVQAST